MTRVSTSSCGPPRSSFTKRRPQAYARTSFSSTLPRSYKKNRPSIYTCIVAVAFFITAVLLVVYDRATVRQNEKTMRSALRTGALVNSVFPASVRDRVMDSANACEDMNGKWRNDNEIEEGRFKSRSIADFFASTTLMCKLTVSRNDTLIHVLHNSSNCSPCNQSPTSLGLLLGHLLVVRNIRTIEVIAALLLLTLFGIHASIEPFQVFELLETIYGAFDVLAKKRDVFKVETVGYLCLDTR
jgi:hypothetical protein